MKGADALELLGIYDLVMKCLQVKDIGVEYSQEWKCTAMLVTFKVSNKA
jgi:hypothetical protein